MGRLEPQAWGTVGRPEPQVGVLAMVDVLVDYEDLLPVELSMELLPRRKVDHRIDLILGVAPLGQPPYQMASAELALLWHQLDELLTTGFIQPSTSPYRALVLFQRKMDGSVQIYVDYQALNRITIRA